MLECLILGDSIGYGISNIRKECIAYVQSGINSHSWNIKWNNAISPAKTVIVSLGSNDSKHTDTKTELENLRKKINADQVFWILPAIKPYIQQIVRDIAFTNGDTVLEISNLQPDHVHPTYKGYQKLSQNTK
jgi:lysophospholipase L1-like esterase